MYLFWFPLVNVSDRRSLSHQKPKTGSDPNADPFIGAMVCGLLGFFLGADFIEWLKENRWGFWF